MQSNQPYLKEFFMHECSNEYLTSIQDAITYLLDELHKFGPIRLLTNTDKPELANRKRTLCCDIETLIATLDIMKKNQLVHEVKVDGKRCTYLLTNKGVLMAYLVRLQSNVEKQCDCVECQNSLSTILSLVEKNGSIELTFDQNCEFPHLKAEDLHVCLENEELGKGLIQLQRNGLIRIDENLIYSLSKRVS
jgi:hypothetical protein